MKNYAEQALGLIETVGMVPAIYGADAMLKAADDETEAATEFALNSPNPDPAHVLDDVFYEGGDD